MFPFWHMTYELTISLPIPVMHFAWYVWRIVSGLLAIPYVILPACIIMKRDLFFVAIMIETGLEPSFTVVTILKNSL